jgi:hypothetical protein
MVRADGDSVMFASPSRPEVRRLGFQSAKELGAPVVSSIPEQLPGEEPGQQERDTKMLSYVGIDVSKGRLDIAVLSEGQSWGESNDATRPGHFRTWPSSC